MLGVTGRGGLRGLLLSERLLPLLFERLRERPRAGEGSDGTGDVGGSVSPRLVVYGTCQAAVGLCICVEVPAKCRLRLVFRIQSR